VTALQALVFARCAGFVFRAPGFSHPSVSAPVRAALAYTMALAIASGVRRAQALDAAGFVCALGTEIVIGAAIGTAASMLYDGAYAGGRSLDDYVGIRASVPSAGIVAGAGFGRLWSLAFTAGFFVFGAHRVAIAAFVHAFDALPPGAFVASGSLATFSMTLPVTLLRAALSIAGPAIATAFVVQVALGAIGRMVPRFSTFTLAFPLVLATALVTTLAGFALVFPDAGRPWFDLAPLRAR
jgi:flagellar biosynthetic protein FliR